MSNKIHVDLIPVNSFRYNQISNYAFNYLLLDNDFKALHTPFECKDYLSDIFWCEFTGNNADIYGISWKKGMVNTESETYFLAMLGGGFKMKKIREELQELLNIFEDAQGFTKSKVHETDNAEIVVVEFSKDWLANGPLLSAFTSLIRLSGAYKIGEDVLEYLKKLYDNRKSPLSGTPRWMYVEIRRLPKTIEKFAALLKGKKVNFTWNKITNINSCHDMGICEFDGFPKIKIKGIDPDYDEDEYDYDDDDDEYEEEW